MEREFESKSVVVTGGTSGLGETVVRMFLERGAKVAALARGVTPDTADRLREGTTAPADHLLAVKCDVSDESQVEDVFTDVVRRFGQIDILHANAAICHSAMNVVDTTIEDWNKIIGINLTGVFLATKHALKHMIPRRYGKIVLTDSSWAHVSEPGYASYVATKGGVLSYGRNLALENGHYNINVNIVCPGNIMTPQLLSAMHFEEPVEESIRKQFGQVCSTEEVAEVVLFLSSDRARALHGASIVIDHGASLRDGKGIVAEAAA